MQHAHQHARVVVVADSATDPPEDLARNLGIVLVSILIRFGEETFRDRINIGVEEVLARLARGELAKTAHPGPADFLRAFRSVLDRDPGATVLCFCISSRLSGAYQSAVVARDLLGDARVWVIDTRAGSLAAAWLVIEAARAAQQGLPPAAIVRRTEAIAGRLRFYAILDDLRYLAHSGRLGRVPAAAGILLDVKPILTLREGEVVLAERARGAGARCSASQPSPQRAWPGR